MKEILLSPEQLSVLISKFKRFSSVTPELIEKALKPFEIPQLSVSETKAGTYEDADEAWDEAPPESDWEKSAMRKRLELVAESVEEEYYDSIEEAFLDFYDDCDNRANSETEKMLIIHAMAEKVVLAA